MTSDNLVPVIERVSPLTPWEALEHALDLADRIPFITTDSEGWPVLPAGEERPARFVHAKDVLQALPDGWALVDTRAVSVQAGTLMAAIADLADEADEREWWHAIR